MHQTNPFMVFQHFSSETGRSLCWTFWFKPGYLETSLSGGVALHPPTSLEGADSWMGWYHDRRLSLFRKSEHNVVARSRNYIVHDIIWYYMILYDIIWYYMILYDIIWYYMILYDIIWYYMVFYDILWYYLILYDDILRASLSEENCTMEFPAKTFVGVISLCSFSAGCWVTAPSLDTWIHIICNLLIFMTAWYYTDIYMHRSGANGPSLL